ncbi:AtpZ/AtpI family protein [Sporolactobacillus sp. THM7-4]|nr:AtpZ/AtpI family protein [Sporolactobacillus sp. THM7-4]
MPKKNNMNPWQMAGMVSSMGFEIFAFILVGSIGGRYLDNRFGFAHLWLPVGAVAGFLFGLLSCYYTLKSFTKD